MRRLWPQQLTAEGLECFRLLFPKGMDANDYACAVKPAEKSLGVVIRSAQWLGRGAANPHSLRVPPRRASAVESNRRSGNAGVEPGRSPLRSQRLRLALVGAHCLSRRSREHRGRGSG